MDPCETRGPNDLLIIVLKQDRAGWTGSYRQLAASREQLSAVPQKHLAFGLSESDLFHLDPFLDYAREPGFNAFFLV
jgi:hypothetical protein